MALWPLVALSLVLLVAGILVIFVMSRRERAARDTPPAVAGMGYGRARWERERALWRGVLRRLEIQARHAQPSASLERQLEEARARLDEAERHLEENQ